MEHYIKRTKENTNIIEMSIFLLKNINEKLKAKGWSRHLQKNDFVLINTNKYPYCWDVIKLIQKYLSDENWECKLTHYLSRDNMYSYTFNLNRRK